MAEESRKPFKGSCHCGSIKYIAHLKFPPALRSGGTGPTAAEGTQTMRLYKCNCTACHKMGIFHLRLIDAANDFVLLSPLDPFRELSDYLCDTKTTHWFFCKTCGVRCFSFKGEGQVVEKTIAGEKKQVWTPKADFVEDKNGYLSVNASTLDSGQEGLDLREWHKKNWIHYVDTLDEKEDDSWEEPHRGVRTSLSSRSHGDFDGDGDVKTRNYQQPKFGASACRNPNPSTSVSDAFERLQGYIYTTNSTNPKLETS